MEHGSIPAVWITLNILCYYTSASFDAALHKSCSQSSTAASRVADGAVDGIIDPLATCSHTVDGESNNWWQVDLAGVYWVHSVLVRNRGDGVEVVFEQQMMKTVDADFHSETVVADVPSCAEYCTTFMGCYAFGYNRATGTCRRYISKVLSNTTSNEFMFFISIY